MYLLDTNIIIYILKNRYLSIIDRIDQAGVDNISVSSVTIAELEYGASKSVRPHIAVLKMYELLMPFEIYDFDSKSAKYYGSIRASLEKKGCAISQLDMMIAAIAMCNNLCVVTNNTREFSRVDGLKVENWVI